MNGLLLVDKPGGITSFDVVRKVRRWCGTRQVGHCGTLDPSATGVLPVALGSATRLVEYLMDGDKEYVASLHLGIVTDTQDGDGQVLARLPWEGVDSEAVRAAADGFVGAIRQLPPMHSALKRDGVPLYRLARQGLEVERQPREVRIDTIDILAVELPEVTLRIRCGKGTYIRTLCHDLGQVLGCGAYMATLRRTRCGVFGIEQCHALAELEKLSTSRGELPLIEPADTLADWPALQVHPRALARLANGVAPSPEDVIADRITTNNAPVRLLADNRLAAVGCCLPAERGADFGGVKLWKVFPEAIFVPEKLYSEGKL